jgi:hypothetical protein
MSSQRSSLSGRSPAKFHSPAVCVNRPPLTRTWVRRLTEKDEAMREPVTRALLAGEMAPLCAKAAGKSRRAGTRVTNPTISTCQGSRSSLIYTAVRMLEFLRNRAIQCHFPSRLLLPDGTQPCSGSRLRIVRSDSARLATGVARIPVA